DSLASSAEAKGFDTIVLLKDGLYKVQIGAFSSKDNADALAARARNAGFDAIVILES
ncbi:SPOR domain-containing protein, partial [Bacillus spizizenii]|nr:SPOR domain-containing protein [Bacillus spizizenii]